MNDFKVCSLRLVFLFSVLLSGTMAFGQTNPMDLIKDVLKPVKNENDTIPEKPKKTSLSLNQLRNFQAEIGRANNMLRRSPDTTEISDFIPRVEALVNGVNEQLNNREVSFNLRMIGSILNFIHFSERSLSKYEIELENRLTALSSAKQNIDSIQGILAKPELITDEQRRSEGYIEFISGIQKSLEITSIELNRQLVTVFDFDSKIQNIKLSLDELDIQLRFESHRLTNNIFSKEIPYLWRPLTEREPGHYAQAIKNAVFFNSAVLLRYLTVFQISTILFIVLVILLIVWFRRTYRLILKDEKNRELIFHRTSYLPKYPRLTAALVLLSLLVLFYPDPPMIIFSAGLFLSGTITGVLLFKRVEKPVFVVWVLFYILFVLCLLSNLYWETVYEERYMIFFMSLAGILLGLYYQLKLKAHTKELPKYLFYIIWIYVAIEFFALVLILFGRLSLSKMLSVTATVSLMQALSLFIFVLIIKEFIYLQIELGNKRNSDPTSTNDYEKLKNKVVTIFSFVAIGLWLYYFLKNLSLFNVIVEEISIFLTTPRSLHYATFSFATILTFFLTLYISTFLANNFAYFTEIRDRKYQGHRNKRFGSQVLIVRLVIISVGFFIALAAAGIPIDRITIVLGALSVGIGFGLQTIINNLVSGVILAFERPIQIGDTIDSGPDQGVVKEIGIRASKIRNWDGADVVIPNGDLLANRLTNWTLHDKHRRVELIIGVSYQSDIDQVTEIIQKSLVIDGLLKFPTPSVYLQKLNENSLDFRVLFWVGDVDMWIIFRDKAIRSIYKNLKENGVQIPFPQRDLHIRSIPSGLNDPGKSTGPDSKMEPKEMPGD